MALATSIAAATSKPTVSDTFTRAYRAFPPSFSIHACNVLDLGLTSSALPVNGLSAVARIAYRARTLAQARINGRANSASHREFPIVPQTLMCFMDELWRRAWRSPFETGATTAEPPIRRMRPIPSLIRRVRNCPEINSRGREPRTLRADCSAPVVERFLVLFGRITKSRSIESICSATAATRISAARVPSPAPGSIDYAANPIGVHQTRIVQSQR